MRIGDELLYKFPDQTSATLSLYRSAALYEHSKQGIPQHSVSKRPSLVQEAYRYL